MPGKREAQISRLLGARIAQLRGQRGLNQEACACRSNVTKAYLSQIESGKRLPALATLIVLADQLHVQVRDLFVFRQDGMDLDLYDALRQRTEPPSSVDESSSP